MKTDCFAFKNHECTILLEMYCLHGKCSFYKTKEQYEQDLKDHPIQEDIMADGVRGERRPDQKKPGTGKIPPVWYDGKEYRMIDFCREYGLNYKMFHKKYRAEHKSLEEAMEAARIK